MLFHNKKGTGDLNASAPELTNSDTTFVRFLHARPGTFFIATKMNDVLRFLLSGPGLIGKQHARLIKSRSDCRLSAVVAPPTAENEGFASAFEANFYVDIEDALAKEQRCSDNKLPEPFSF